MNPRHRRPLLRIAAWPLCAGMLVCAASGVSAQEIYRQIGVDGHITYTDQPGTTPPPQAVTGPPLDVASALASNFALSSRHAATVDANEAARRLRQAQQELVLDAKRLPRLQARGSTAGEVSDRYDRRQEELQHQVERAQRRFIETQQALRAHPRQWP